MYFPERPGFTTHSFGPSRSLSFSMRFLIVDDNPQVRAMIRDVLAGTESSFFECSDGDEAVAGYVAHKPDWVLMDIKMTRMDGITATRAIKGLHADARIIIVTNFEDHGVRSEALRAGAEAYVLKENVTELRRIVGERRANTP